MARIKIKTRRPDNDLPLCFFEGLTLPNIRYSDYSWKPIHGNVLADDEIYQKREVLSGNMAGDEFTQIRNEIIKLLEIIENSYDYNMEAVWPIDPWYKPEDFTFNIIKDYPGFSMSTHLDNRNVKWTLIINLEDNFSCTRFQIPNRRTISGPTKKGSGVFYFNHHELYHSIDVLDTRYILFYQNMITR